MLWCMLKVALLLDFFLCNLMSWQLLIFVNSYCSSFYPILRQATKFEMNLMLYNYNYNYRNEMSCGENYYLSQHSFPQFLCWWENVLAAKVLQWNICKPMRRKTFKQKSKRSSFHFFFQSILLDCQNAFK